MKSLRLGLAVLQVALIDGLFRTLVYSFKLDGVLVAFGDEVLTAYQDAFWVVHRDRAKVTWIR